MHLKRAIELLRVIPRGKVTTYGEIARIVKTHPRAIGKIMNSNKSPVRYPCYKVVMSDGSIGGYGSGVRKKIVLLKKDGIEIKNGKLDLKKYMFRLGSNQNRRQHKRK